MDNDAIREARELLRHSAGTPLSVIGEVLFSLVVDAELAVRRASRWQRQEYGVGFVNYRFGQSDALTALYADLFADGDQEAVRESVARAIDARMGV